MQDLFQQLLSITAAGKNKMVAVQVGSGLIL